MRPNQRVLGSGLPSGVPLPRLDRVRNEGHGGTVPVDAPAVHSLGLSAAGRTGLGPVAIGLGRCDRPGIDQNVHTGIVLPGIRFCGAKGRVLRPDGSLGVQQRRPHLWREDAAGPVRHHLLSQGIVGGDLSGANQIRRSAPSKRSEFVEVRTYWRLHRSVFPAEIPSWLCRRFYRTTCRTGGRGVGYFILLSCQHLECAAAPLSIDADDVPRPSNLSLRVNLFVRLIERVLV